MKKVIKEIFMFKSVDQMADAIKFFESQNESKLMAGCPIIMRLDGKGFHNFTKNLTRPFDEKLTQCMIETTEYLVKEFQADFGYTQSDEITLIFKNELNFDNDKNKTGSTFMFDGRLQKLCSLGSAKCTSKFMQCIMKYLPHKVDDLPAFDNRVFQVPSKELASYVFYWRFLDCKKNAISMAASAVVKNEKLLVGKSSKDRIAILAENGIQFDDYANAFKYGTMILVKKELRAFSDDELQSIPEKHRPTAPVLRTVIKPMACNVYAIHKQNQLIDLIFDKQFKF